MLIKHIANNDDIFIQIDSDTDGYTSSAVLINYLNCLFPYYVQNHITYRVHEGKQHGIIIDTIPSDTKMVIIPDAGSNQYDEHQYLKEHCGIDVLVIDHHETDRESEYAYVINNQICDYPTKSLSGVGMVYKFCSYIDELLNVDYANDYLDLVALGMIADMMSLADFETKHLINLGLQNIKNPFMSYMTEKQAYSLGEEITPIGIAFYIAPYVNATVRMGTLNEKYLLFKSMLETDAYIKIPSTKRGCSGQMETIVEQACRNCTNIKNHQTKARDKNTEIIEKLIHDYNLLDNKILVIPLSKEYKVDKNLTGLIANQLMSKYCRPVLLLNETTDEEGNICWEGSGRNYGKSEFTNLKDFLNNSNCVMYAEGHQMAMGLGVKNEKLKEFIQYINLNLQDFNFEPSYNVDFIFNNEINEQAILKIASMKNLWGQDIDEPYVAIENLKITKNNIQLLSRDKNPTLKITLPNGISLIKFKSSIEEYENLYSETGYNSVNIIGRCEKNIWNGNVSAQIIIEDYEIVNSAKYYF